MLLCHLSERDCILATRCLPAELNRINFLSASLHLFALLLPFCLSTSNKVNFPPAKPQSFRRLAASSRARKAIKLSATAEKWRRRKRKWQGGRGGKRWRREDGDRVEYDLRVAYLSSIRYSHSGFTLDSVRCR